MRSARLAALALAVAWALAALPAEAHRLKLHAMLVGERIEGRAYFVGGGPAIVDVLILPSEGGDAMTVTTDGDGHFTATVGPAPSFRLVANAGDGHAAETVIGSALPVPAPAVLETPDLEAIVARQLEPLRAELAAAEERVRFRDIIGGLGYIVGLAGLAAWISSRRTAR